MAHKKRTQSPGYLWEQAMLDAYADYRWQQVLDPLYQKLQEWKAGDLGHWEVSEAIHLVHKKTQELLALRGPRKKTLREIASSAQNASSQ
jgi:hypothetical protein